MSVSSLLLPTIGLACVALAVLWAAAALQAGRRPRVLCLMYHRVAPRAACEGLRGIERVFTLPEDAFDAQLRWLRENHFRFLRAGELVRFARDGRQLEDRSVLISIDDGCASAHARMLPILARHRAPAILFVTTSPESPIFRIGGAAERRVTDDEIRAVAAAGVEIASHAVSHRPLSVLSDAEIRRELADSKRELERITGASVRHFAVPGNWYDDRVLRIARELGYEAVFCSRPDSVRAGSGSFGIPRINIEGHLDLEGFRRTLSPASIAQRRLVMALRGLPKRALGPRLWTRLRQGIRREVGGRWLSPAQMATALRLAVGLGALAALGWLLTRG